MLSSRYLQKVLHAEHFITECVTCIWTDESFITFSYSQAEQTAERRINNKMREKAAAVERNLDGTVKAETIRERSHFVRDAASGMWLLSGSKIDP
eukprot:698868-Pelagomonas_calceolata.AAC.1